MQDACATELRQDVQHVVHSNAQDACATELRSGEQRHREVPGDQHVEHGSLPNARTTGHRGGEQRLRQAGVGAATPAFRKMPFITFMAFCTSGAATTGVGACRIAFMAFMASVAALASVMRGAARTGAAVAFIGGAARTVGAAVTLRGAARMGAAVTFTFGAARMAAAATFMRGTFMAFITLFGGRPRRTRTAGFGAARIAFAPRPPRPRVRFDGMAGQR